MEDDLFDVFRDEDPRLVWIGSVGSMEAARELIRSEAATAQEKFIIYGVVTHTRIHLRAEDCS